MPWLTVTEYLCNRRLHICCFLLLSKSQSGPFHIHNGNVTKVTQRMPLVVLKMSTLREGTIGHVWVYVMLVMLNQFVCSFYKSWFVFVCFLMVIVLSVLLQITASHYLFTIFKLILLNCLSI